MTLPHGHFPPDLFGQIAILFRRYCQRDQSERIGFAIHQQRGVEWNVAVFLGDVPPKIAEHYQRSEVVVGARSQDHAESYRVERGPSVVAAYEKIRDDLVEKLRLRITSDQDAMVAATGAPVPPPVPVVVETRCLPSPSPRKPKPDRSDGNPGSHSV